MNHSIEITRALITPSRVEFQTRYLVVRGDGLCKVFHNLLAPGPPQVWDKPGDKYDDYNKCILIPVDIMTAVRLRLVQFDELQLPEGMRALLNLIK